MQFMPFHSAKSVKGDRLMHVAEAWKREASKRSLIVVVPLCVLLLASVIWNVRLYRLSEQHRLQVLAMKQQASAKAAKAVAEAERAKREKQAAAASNARVDQLYQEISNLTRMSEHVMLQSQIARSLPTKKDRSQENAGPP
jgi:hypothetical protein